MQVPNKARIEVVEPQPKRLLPGMIVYHPNGEILASVREVKDDGRVVTAWRYTRASKEIWLLASEKLVVVRVVLDGY